MLLVCEFKECCFQQDHDAVPQNVPKYFCALTVLNPDEVVSRKPQVSSMLSKSDKTTWLSPKAFKTHVKDLLKKAIRTSAMKEVMSSLPLRFKTIGKFMVFCQIPSMLVFY